VDHRIFKIWFKTASNKTLTKMLIFIKVAAVPKLNSYWLKHFGKPPGRQKAFIKAASINIIWFQKVI
jgi:hypothetical protein